jgi:hypothetical protein
MLAAGAIALFFVRSWTRNGDRFFLLFGLAFGLMAVERCILVLVPAAHEFRPFVYLIRLAAFLLILAAIADKNRGSDRR